MADQGQPSIAAASLRGLCPRCGAASLFGGWTRFADRCATCGLDFSRFNVGDGPAAFLTLVLGTIVVILAVAVELTLHPPLWAHLLLWTPLLLVGTIWSLRVAKAALAASEWRNDAREAGRP